MYITNVCMKLLQCLYKTKTLDVCKGTKTISSSYYIPVIVSCMFKCYDKTYGDYYFTKYAGKRVILSVCVCACVFFPFILDIKFVGRTSRGHTGGRSHRIFHPPSFCGACLKFSREKDSAIPFPRRP